MLYVNQDLPSRKQEEEREKDIADWIKNLISVLQI